VQLAQLKATPASSNGKTASFIMKGKWEARWVDPFVGGDPNTKKIPSSSSGWIEGWLVYDLDKKTALSLLLVFEGHYRPATNQERDRQTFTLAAVAEWRHAK
jgi:hypothetical protein